MFLMELYANCLAMDDVDQWGSLCLCNDEKLRFDFSHKKALSTKQLRVVEEMIKHQFQALR